MSETPSRIGPYAIERRLGAGGMAETFVAVRRMQSIEQRVCLKRILPAYARDATARKLFQREANITARLRHANLVQVFDVGEDHGTPYLVMELVEGCDLDHVLDRAPDRKLSPDLVGYLLSEIAHGLHEAHGGGGAHDGVVHRDLSPSNVLLSTSGEVKVADFGIAKALSSGDKATATMMRGKFAYMAPEQLDGGALDPRADMFALGVMGYEMLAGVRPFEAETDARLVLLIAKNERRPLLELAPDAPRELVDTIEALLSPKKEERPANGHDIVERLAPMLPPTVTARRKLGKLVAAAYEERLEALAREPTSPGEGPAFAATVMADGGTAPVGTPMVVSPPITRPADPATYRSGPASPSGPTLPTPAPDVLATPPPSRARLVGGAVGLGGLLAAVGLGIFFSMGGSTVPPTTAAVPPVALTPPGSVPAPTPTPATTVPATTVPTTTAPTTVAGAGVPTAPAITTAPPTSIATVPPASGTTPATSPGGRRTRPPPSSAPTTTPPDTTDAPDPGHDGRDATVHVVVSPWGQVWIDGRFMGRSPVNTTLRPGSHRIAAGTTEPTVSRTVRLRAGQDERVELDLE